MPSPANTPAPKSASATDVVPALSFEDQLRAFWEKNSGMVTAVIVAIIVVVLAKGAWDYFATQRELDVRQAYAAATTSSELKSFVAAHPDHALAAVAQLRLADEAFTAGKYTDAITGYEQASAALKTGPLASRARLGLAIAKYVGGHPADGETALKAIASDPSEIKPYRAEALFHLAAAAADAGRAADQKTFTAQLSALDATSPWTSRAMQLPISAK